MTMTAFNDAALKRLREFLENGCDARPEDRHHALQDLDVLAATLRDAPAPAATAQCPLCRGAIPTDDATLRHRLASALAEPMDLGVVLDPTDERLKVFSKPEQRRIIAAMCACEGVSTPMLEATCPSWLDVVKLMEEQLRSAAALPATSAAGAVPEGMVMVKRDAYEGFIRLLENQCGRKHSKVTPQRAVELARAMLAAAPQPAGKEKP